MDVAIIDSLTTIMAKKKKDFNIFITCPYPRPLDHLLSINIPPLLSLSLSLSIMKNPPPPPPRHLPLPNELL